VRKIGNPVIFQDTSNRLWLFYASTTVGGWSMTSINYKISSDGGETWSKSQKMRLTPVFNITSNVKNKPVHLSDGSFLLPIYQESIRKTAQLLWVKLTDNGISYRKRQMTHLHKAMQPSIIHQEKKKLIAFLLRARYTHTQ